MMTSVGRRASRAALNSMLAAYVVAALPDAARAADTEQCGRDYHAALAQIAQTHVAPATEALAASKRSEPGATGRWMFGPYARKGKAPPRPVAGETVTETSERVVCVTPASEEGGACRREETRRRQKQVTLDPLAPPAEGRSRDTARQEQALYHLADGIVRASAQVIPLQMQAPPGIVARRVASDLRGYTGQVMRPAICAGAPELVEHLEKQAGIFRRQVQSMQHGPGTARDLAAARIAGVKALVERVMVARGAAIVTGAIVSASTAEREPVPAPVPAGRGSLKDLVAEAADLALAGEDVDAVAAEPTPLAALRTLHKARSERAVALQSADVREALEDALGVLEAAAYVDHSGRLHAQAGDGLIGGLAAIRAAHVKACTCGPR